MPNTNYFQDATIKNLQNMLELTNLTPEINLDNRRITLYSVDRPALQLAGYFDFFVQDRVLLIGIAEQHYLASLDEKTIKERFDKICSFSVPCIIFTAGGKVCPIITESCRNADVPLFSTEMSTYEVSNELVRWLRVALAKKEEIHGVLVEVYGVGVLIRGESGIGKSETALELVNRGHRLVADDLIVIRKMADDSLMGSAPEVTRDFIELRGVGIINVRSMFGFAAVRTSQSIDIVIDMGEYRDNELNRLGLEKNYAEILGNQVPCYTVPIRPGRNTAVIVECIALNDKASTVVGQNAAQEMIARINSFG